MNRSTIVKGNVFINSKLNLFYSFRVQHNSSSVNLLTSMAKKIIKRKFTPLQVFFTSIWLTKDLSGVELPWVFKLGHILCRSIHSDNLKSWDLHVWRTLKLDMEILWFLWSLMPLLKGLLTGLKVRGETPKYSQYLE